MSFTLCPFTYENPKQMVYIAGYNDRLDHWKLFSQLNYKSHHQIGAFMSKCVRNGSIVFEMYDPLTHHVWILVTYWCQVSAGSFCSR